MRVTLFLLLCLIVCACNNKNDNTTKVKSMDIKQEDKRKMTIILIDASGSFNKIVSNGKSEINYFDLSCCQIKAYLENADIGNEYIMIRQITDDSFQENAFVSKLDMVAIPFKEPPQNPLGLKKYYEEKKAYTDSIKLSYEILTRNTIDSIEQFKTLRSNKGFRHTDILQAINCAKHFSEDEKFNNYEKRLIIYSDFRENVCNLEKENPIVLSDFEITGVFVSKQNHTYKTYNELLAAWGNILICKRIKFKTPEESL